MSAGATRRVTVSSTTAARKTFTGLTLPTSGSYETITLEIQITSGTPTLHLLSLSFWLESTSSPLSAGVDSSGVYPLDDDDAADDSPLPVHLLRRMAANLEIIAERPGVVMAWSDDFRLITKSSYNTTGNQWIILHMPVRYGPKTTALRVHANGFCDDTSKCLRVWTSQGSYSDAMELALPTNAAWTADQVGSFVTGTIALDDAAGTGGTKLHAEIEGSTGNPASLFSLCVWEEV